MTDPAQDGPPALGTPETGSDSAATGSQAGQRQSSADNDRLLAVVKNLSEYHREHEKYYSEAPLTDAISLQRIARTLIALAERWTSVQPAAAPAPSPFAAAPDLNDDRAIETSGVLFMEGGGEPAEITRIKSELQAIAASGEQSGAWLAAAMEASWAMAEALLSYPSSPTSWPNGTRSSVTAGGTRLPHCSSHGSCAGPSRSWNRSISRPAPCARTSPAYLFSAAELINHAADLSAASSVLTHEDERRWRIFHERVKQITAPG